MDFEIPRRWAIVRYQSLGPGPEYRLTYRDSDGRALAFGPAHPRLTNGVQLAGLEDSTSFHMAMGEAFGRLVAAIPRVREGPHGGGPIPVPLFMDLPAELAIRPWEEAGPSFLPGVQPDRIRIVRLTHRRWRPRPAFGLPYLVVAVGEAEATLWAIRTADWYQDPEVQHHGLVLRTLAPRRLNRMLREEPEDVVVCPASEVRQVLAICRKLAGGKGLRPRLVVAIGAEPAALLADSATDAGSIPPGLAVVARSEPLAESSSFVSRLLYGLVHDYPIHEAAADVPFGSVQTIVMADPASNHGLRMADAYAGLVVEADALLQAAPPSDLEPFISEIAGAAPESVVEHLTRASGRSVEIRGATDRVLHLAADFRREQFGLAPLAHARADLIAARAAASKMRRLMASVADWEPVSTRVSQRQDRRVDVTLERREHSPLLRPFQESSGAVWVDRTVVLRGRATYRLHVVVGYPSMFSLMSEEAPPLDPLLPGRGGHSLEVCVYGLDFGVVGRRVRRTYLPPAGQSQPVTFDVVAPPADVLEREGRLRIALYHQNHLLQSFVLTALVGPEERRASTRVLSVHLEASETERFTNLHDLEPRLLSIGVNQGPGPTHTLMMKKDARAREVTLNPVLVADVVRRFRAALIEETFNPDGSARFSSNPAPEAASSEAFATAIRKLARLGHELRNALFANFEDLADLIRETAGALDQTIQVVRHDPNAAFPWAALYDHSVPPEIVGVPDRAPICLGAGQEDPSSGADAPVRRCSHGLKEEVFCIWGFWGIRHRIEEIISFGTRRDAIRYVARSSRERAVCLSLYQRDDFTTALSSTLQDALGADAVVELGNEDLIDLLWDVNRPGLLVLLGHHRADSVAQEPAGPRFLLPGGRWLLPNQITDREINDGDWNAPNPIVLLMACGSGATTMTTLNDFVKAIARAGAAAVVGTEATVFMALATRFASEVTLDLRQRPLGEAVTLFRRRLLVAGNPLPFVFTPIGSADLMLVL